MLDFLNTLDTRLLLLINGWNSTFGDWLMVFASGKLSWLPLYLLLLYLIIRKLRVRSWLTLLFVGLLIVATDQLSVHAFKEVFLRLRPCHNPELEGLVRLVKGCGGQYGFVSSHASNTFGLATFLWLLLRKFYRFTGWMLAGWAVLVGYSRIYLGVHYPGDVLGGALLGMLTGWVLFLLYRQAAKRLFGENSGETA